MTLFQRLRRAAPLVGALVLLTACGPNGGGTGTGESFPPLSTFGATAASSCSSPFAQALSCGAVSAISVDASALPGTGDVDFAGGAGRDRVRLHLGGNLARLEAQCGRARFDGEWGVRGDGQAGYFGAWRLGDEPDGRPAQLRVEVLAPDRLRLSVVDAADGRLLQGVDEVVRSATPPELPDC